MSNIFNITNVITSVFYADLDEVQKQKAIGIMRDLENEDQTTFWSEDVIEYWKEYLDSEYGIQDADICWSGFYSQGDGASISTDYYIDIEKFLRKCKVWSKFRVLHNIVNREEVYAKIERISHTYCHEYTVKGSVELDYNIDWTPKQEEAAERLEEYLTETIRGLSRDVYTQLDKENDFQLSDEALWSNIEANEYCFDVDWSGEVLSIS